MKPGNRSMQSSCCLEKVLNPAKYECILRDKRGTDFFIGSSNASLLERHFLLA